MCGYLAIKMTTLLNLQTILLLQQLTDIWLSLRINQKPNNHLEGKDGVGGGREVQEGGTFVSLWLSHVLVWQKPIQHCKPIIFQLKINLKRKDI